VGVVLGYGSSQNLGVPFNIYVMAQARDFKFDAKLKFAKSAKPWALLVDDWLVRPYMHGKLHGKLNHTERQKWAQPSSGELPKIWGSPVIFLQWLKLAISNLVHSLGLPIIPS